MPSSLRSVVAREVIKSRVRGVTRRFAFPVTVCVVVLTVVAILAWVFFCLLRSEKKEDEPSPHPTPPSKTKTKKKKTAGGSAASEDNGSKRDKTKNRERRKKKEVDDDAPSDVIGSLRALCDRVKEGSRHGGDVEAENRVGDALLAMGEIYRTGSFPRFAPDDEAAETCFKTCARRFGGRVAAMGQLKVMECLRSPVAREDRTGSVLPGKFARIATDACAMTTFSSGTSRPRMPRHGESPTVPDDVGGGGDMTVEELLAMTAVDGEDDAEHALAALTTAAIQPVEEEGGGEAAAAPYRADAQNVHDHGVTSAVSTNLRAISSRRRPREGGETVVEQVARRLRGCRGLSQEDRDNAQRVLYNLNGTDAHSTYGVTEQEALASVWADIQASPHRENLVETLGKQLASGVEHGFVVCSSGKIARIVGTLDGVHNDVTARPMDVVRQEIAGMAVVVRNEVEARYGDRGDGEEEDAEQEMRELLKRRAHAEYVRHLGMNEVLVMPLVEEFCAGF